MYSQEFSHYRRPDTTGVVWLTPQQVDAIRLNATVEQSVNRDTVRVRQIKPQVRSTPDENAEVQHLLQTAPRFVAACLSKGVACIHVESPLAINTVLKNKARPCRVRAPHYKSRRPNDSRFGPRSVAFRRKLSALQKAVWQRRRAALKPETSTR